jgi:glycosyltransferase involved in cell wall biosynthesis
MAELVTVLMPTLNRASLIRGSVASVLSQSYRNLELLVLDGGSTDGTAGVLGEIKDGRLRVVCKPGMTEVDAYNYGKTLARGTILGICASDDCYVPDAVESAVRWLSENPGHCAVVGDALYVAPDGSSLHRGHISWRGRVDPDNLRWVTALRHKCAIFTFGASFWRRELFPAFDNVFSRRADDDAFARVIRAGGCVGNMKKVQVHYTVHPGMGAKKFKAECDAQQRLHFERIGMKWYHRLVWRTVGPFAYWLANPYARGKYYLK